LFTIYNPPESWGKTSYRVVEKIASGIPQGCSEPYDCEYLAVQIDWDTFSSCANLHLAIVNECVGEDDTCLSDTIVAGLNPSWAGDGRLFHTYQGWTNRAKESNCATNMIGIWDGENLESVTKGFEPKAIAIQD
jgi:hypothetical protein